MGAVELDGDVERDLKLIREREKKERKRGTYRNTMRHATIQKRIKMREF